ALLHYYFGSKEKLYEEVLFRFFADVFSRLAQNFQDAADPETAFRSFIHAYVDLLSARPELPRLMVSEVLEGGRHIMAVVDRIFSRTGVSPPRLIGPFIEKAVADNLIRPVDPMQTTISVVGMCVFYFVARPLMEHIWGKPADEKAFVAQRKEAIIDLVLYGITKRQAENEEKNRFM
ncbi:MAG: TetR family transcriptional regulator C-terminal domain-containing protein, partial [Thermodesulfobacteriota bacterium]